MHFQLPNGRTINISPTMIINLTDEEFDNEINDLLCKNIGFETNDVWDGSVLSEGEIKSKKTIETTDEDSDQLPFDDIRDFFTPED